MRSWIAPLAVAVALAGVLAASASVMAAEPLVNSSWLKDNLAKPGLVVIDLRSGGGAVREDYVKEHIPGSVFSDYANDGWREKIGNVVGMLPPPEKVEKVIGALGIDNTSHVVIVPMGRQALDMGAATRLYWTFKVMGHDEVSILDGGWLGWTKDVDAQSKKPVNPLASGGVTPVAKTFKANVRKEMLITSADVESARVRGVTLVDNRPNDHYVGATVIPTVKKAGTIPGAKNVPESWITGNNGGTVRTKALLTSLYRQAGVSSDVEQIAFCNTGHWASLGWFASHEVIGNKKVLMYDGSMAEWTLNDALPIEQKISLN
jgi:thiosulfate/3-mercaptopyruvate sulfurtransferase